jgi:hypothetical protein
MKPKTKSRSKKPVQKESPETKQADKPLAKAVDGLDSSELAEMLDAKIEESKGFWNGGKYKLDKRTQENEKFYLGEQVSDDDDGEQDNLTLDNRIFSSVRTIVPYVTTRITEPEVYPSSNSVAAKKFANDLEKALHIKADKENVKAKAKFSVEDAIIRRRGYLKPRYDAATKNFFSVEYVPAESIIIDHKARSYEEPRYFRHCLEKSVDDLVIMFPDKEERIKELFNIKETSSKADYQALHDINEDWSFVTIKGELDLVVCWSYKKEALGVIKDPNWRYGKTNFLENHMMPLVFFNVLNDGRTYIDKTSYVEQAKYSQNTIDKRGKQIGENAGLGSVGMPIVDSEALDEEQTEYLTYQGDTAIVLKVPDGKRIQDVFDTWKASTLPADVYKDKVDSIEAVNNAFGASSINQGVQSDNNTLGQDILLRDQSQGRQQDIVDAIDAAMNRLYLLMAQFMLVYGEEDELFRYVGENSEFDYIIMNTSSLDTNAEIRVKAGTSMPIDKSQRRATAKESANMKMIDPLSYWEIMDEPNAQKYAKRLMDFMADPKAFLSDTEEEIFNRDAYVDIEMIKQKQVPPFRDDLDKSYFDYLNKYVLSGDLESPKIDAEVKQAISSFIDIQLARGQKMLGMAETQLPTPQDVQTHNDKVDAANAADAAAAKGLPPAPPTSEPAPAPADVPAPSQPLI